jgi:hypothetical protein
MPRDGSPFEYSVLPLAGSAAAGAFSSLAQATEKLISATQTNLANIGRTRFIQTPENGDGFFAVSNIARLDHLNKLL